MGWGGGSNGKTPPLGEQVRFSLHTLAAYGCPYSRILVRKDYAVTMDSKYQRSVGIELLSWRSLPQGLFI
jgi:hypothetical protein